PEPGKLGRHLSVMKIGLQDLQEAQVLECDSQHEKQKLYLGSRYLDAMQVSGSRQKKILDRKPVILHQAIAAHDLVVSMKIAQLPCRIVEGQCMKESRMPGPAVRPGQLEAGLEKYGVK